MPLITVTYSSPQPTPSTKADIAAAVSELQQANQQDPFVLVLLAQAYEKAGDAAKAHETYEKVLASNAHNVNNAFARAMARKKI